jgi:flagellar basal body-associated protein FliL
MNNKKTIQCSIHPRKKEKLSVLLLLIILMMLTACTSQTYYYIMDDNNIAAKIDASIWECKSFELDDRLLVGCVNTKTGENESYLATALIYED